MKKLSRIIASAALCVMMGVMLVTTAFAASTAYEVRELNMSIPIENDMLVITRDSKKTDSFFSKFKLEKEYEETMNKLKDGNIYLEAMKDDSSLTLTVTMTKTSDSESIGNYTKLSDDELTDVKTKLLEDSLYKSASYVDYKGIKYINLAMSYKEGKKTVYAQQYNTVINGENINITLQSAPGKKLTKDNKDMLAKTVEGTTILEKNFFTENKMLLIYIGAGVFGVALVVVVLVILIKRIKNPNLKHKNLVHELAHEHKLTKTTQIPRKTIFDVTKPTNSFLTNYEPVEEIDRKDSKKAQPVAEKVQTAKAVSAPVVEEEEAPVQVVEEAVEVQPETVRPEPVAVEEPEVQEPEAEEIVEETVSAEEGFDAVADYFDDGDEQEIYAEEEPVQPVRTAEVENYDRDDTPVQSYPEYDEDYEEPYIPEGGSAWETTKKIFCAIGRGIVKVFKAIFLAIWVAITHCKYFCINLSRLIKRKRAQKKHAKLQEERRRQASEQRRAQREASRNRTAAPRGNNGLVKVHSREERAPRDRSSRTAYPSRRRSDDRRR